MRTFKIMSAAATPGVMLALAWWVVSPHTFAGSNPIGLYTSVGVGGVVGMGLIHLVLVDLIN